MQGEAGCASIGPGRLASPTGVFAVHPAGHVASCSCRQQRRACWPVSPWGTALGPPAIAESNVPV
eukprot:11485920-Prorocentrum_lima.AAC.1